METLDDPIVIEPKTKARNSVIWLHGLGADGHDFEPLVPELRLPMDAAVRFVFPHAPFRPVTINGGTVMRAWYDIFDLPEVQEEDETGIKQSSDILRLLIEKEIKSGIPASRIMVAGFSQGGAIALHTGLSYPQSLAGIIALSTYLPLMGSFTPGNSKPPVLMAHGTLDDIISITIAEKSRDFLQSHGYNISWSTYLMGHTVCTEEIQMVSGWLNQYL